jgi:hypothetical protein
VKKNFRRLPDNFSVIKFFYNGSNREITEKAYPSCRTSVVLQSGQNHRLRVVMPRPGHASFLTGNGQRARQKRAAEYGAPGL